MYSCTLLNFNILYTIDTNIKNLFKNLSKSKEVLTKGMLIEKVKWRKLKRRECCLLCKKEIWPVSGESVSVVFYSL